MIGRQLPLKLTSSCMSSTERGVNKEGPSVWVSWNNLSRPVDRTHEQHTQPRVAVGTTLELTDECAKWGDVNVRLRGSFFPGSMIDRTK